jgi:hypothetical protein
MVAELIQKQNIGTLLFDVLTEEEDKIYENRFNIDLLVSIDRNHRVAYELHEVKGLPLAILDKYRCGLGNTSSRLFWNTIKQ